MSSKRCAIARAADVDPPLTQTDRYLREQMTAAEYRHLLAIGSIDGLVEASHLSRILGGVGNEIQSTLTRVLIEEYGGGRLPRKHSTFFAQMLAHFDMSTEPEAYFDLVPWQVLASINHNYLLTERKRYFLRYNGGLTYFEVAGRHLPQLCSRGPASGPLGGCDELLGTARPRRRASRPLDGG